MPDIEQVRRGARNPRSQGSGGFFKRHRKAFIVLGIILVVVIALILFAVVNIRNAVSNLNAAPQTYTLTRMDLQEIVSGTGTLQSTASRDVTSSLSYAVTDIYVKEGDQVAKGQTLAQLDTTEPNKNIADTQKSIDEAVASDALALSQAQRKLSDATSARDTDSKNNDKAVQDASSALSAANSDVKTAKSNLDPAVNDLNTALSSVLSDTSLVASIRSAGDLQYQFEQSGQPESVFFAYGYTLDSANSYLSIYFTRYSSANSAYQNALTVASNAQNAYDKAVDTRDTAYRNDTTSIQNAQDSVDSLSLKDSSETYRKQLQGYEDDLANCRITAPVAGTVTSIGAKVGSSAGGGGGMSASSGSSSSALFTIEGTDSLEISSSIAEYDAVNVKVGMKVAITSDALDGQQWSGVVSSISPKATDTSSNFTVVIEVTPPVGQLAIGMSTKFNIITDTKPGVFAVPYDAVTTNAQGQSIVYEYTPPARRGGGNTPTAGSAADASGAAGTGVRFGTEVVVQTGMETDYYIEISGSGLTEGMVLLADPEGKNVSSTTSSTGALALGRG